MANWLSTEPDFSTIEEEIQVLWLIIHRPRLCGKDISFSTSILSRKSNDQLQYELTDCLIISLLLVTMLSIFQIMGS